MKSAFHLFGILVVGAISLTLAHGQPIVPSFEKQDVDTTGYVRMYGKGKVLPKGYEKQALIALSYFPELQGVKVVFEVRKDLAALTTMPTLWSIFLHPSNRTYVITISNETSKLFEPILLKNLSYDAQIGVLGHELSHVSDFQGYNFFEFIVHAIKYTFSMPYGDKFEYNTDNICINHLLGYQLRAWSIDTHNKLDMKAVMKEFGIKEMTERYMYPATIDRIIAVHPAYKN